MKTERRVWFPLAMLMLVILSCSLPDKLSTEDRIRTQIAQTRTADPNSVALVEEEQGATATATPEGPGPSRTLTATQADEPTDTPTPTATLTATSSEDQSDPDCNIATFIKDVTIPDGTEMSAGEAFTKTWRLKNVGTCTWTTSYAVVFVSGEQMGAAGEINLSKKVPPGESVDITIDMTAPGAAGDYRGNWKLRSSDGVVFGLTTGKAFYVVITVK